MGSLLRELTGEYEAYLRDESHTVGRADWIAFPRTEEEVARVLLPGGVFLLADTTAPGPFRQAIDLLLPYGRGGDVHLYGTEELRQLLSRYLQGAECRRADATSLLAWGIKGRASGAKGG